MWYYVFMALQLHNHGLDTDIYPNQEQTAKLVHQELQIHKQICTKSEPQPGKTGMAFFLASLCCEQSQKVNISLKTIIIVSSELTTLYEQTLARFDSYRRQHQSLLIHNPAYPNNTYVVLNPGKLAIILKRLQAMKASGRPPLDAAGNFLPLTQFGLFYKPTTDRLLVINDESQLGCLQGSIIDKFLDSLGINWGGDPNLWKNQQAYVVCLSATDFAKEIKNQVKPNFFKFVDFINGPGFKGIEATLNLPNFNDRRNHKYFNGIYLSDWMENTVLPAMMAYYRQYIPTATYNPVARLRVADKTEGMTLKGLLESWGNRVGVDVGIKLYHSADDNLSELKAIEFQPLCPVSNRPYIFFAIYCRALSVGHTIDFTSTILMVEALAAKNGANVSKIVQEVGRLNGYNKNHKFPIYAVSDALVRYVDSWIKGIDNVIPKGTHTKGALRTIKHYIYTFLAGAAPPGIGVMQVSTTNVNDLANLVLLQRAYPDEKGRPRAIKFDKANPNFPSSFDELLEAAKLSHPEVFDALGNLKPDVYAVPKEILATNTSAKKALHPKHVLNRT